MGRIERINEMVKREIGTILLDESRDPRLKFVTVLRVDVSKDLQHAKVYYSVLGHSLKAVQEALANARGFIRRLVGERVIMRYTPELDFIYDQSLEYSDRIHKTLADIAMQKAQERGEQQ